MNDFEPLAWALSAMTVVIVIGVLIFTAINNGSHNYSRRIEACKEVQLELVSQHVEPLPQIIPLCPRAS